MKEGIIRMGKTIVSSASELNDLLVKKYGNEISTDPLTAMMGNIQGNFKGSKISISFGKDEYLVISTDNNGKEILEKLKPTLVEVMGNAESICSYDLQVGDSEQAMPTIEWDIKNPEDRIKEIVNGRAFNGDSKISNLILCGDRKIENYLEDEKAKEERITNAKIYGIYPGSIKDVKKIEAMSEIDLYMNIEGLGGFIWQCNHDMAHGRIEKVDLTEEQYALEYMVYQTTKFGVEHPEPQIDKHIGRTPSYNAWYSFYHNHFQNVLTNEDWEMYQKLQDEGKDVSAYLPSGSWKDELEETNKKIKK
jgi:hypothetical protein